MTPNECFEAMEQHKRVRAFYANDRETKAEGEIIGYTVVPAVIIQTADGERVTWRHDLVEVIDFGSGPYNESGAST